MKRWQTEIKNWLIFYHQPVLVVQYEALKEDPNFQVRRMLKFLNVEYNATDIDERLKNNFESFHRRRHPQEFEHFTKQQKSWVNSMVKEISSLLSFHKKSKLLSIDQYIME